MPLPLSVTAESVPSVVASATVPPELGTLLPAASFSRTVIVEVVLSATTEPGLAVIVEVRVEGAPALTLRVAVSLIVPVLVSVAVTVCEPAVVALQVAPVQEPSGEIVKVMSVVTSPSELFSAS